MGPPERVHPTNYSGTGGALQRPQHARRLPYSQKTQTRPDSGGYAPAIAHTSACKLPTTSRILNTALSTWSCCRFALYPYVCHAADSFRRRASWYSFPCCVPTVIATTSSKVARPKRVNNALSARTPTVLIIAFSWISSTKDVPPRSQSRSST